MVAEHRHQLMLVSNMAARLAQGVAAAVAVPVYANMLGGETYGVLGFIATLGAFLAFLDLGLPALVALLAARSDPGLTCTMHAAERLLWWVGISLGSTLALASWWLAGNWLNPESIPRATVAGAIAISGIALALRFPSAVRSSALQAGDHQGACNLILAALAIMQHGGAILLLLLQQRDVLGLVAWQAAWAVLHWLTIGYLWRKWGSAMGVVKPIAPLRAHRPYLLGMTASAFCACASLQADRLIASAQLSLDQFAPYSLAATAAGMSTVLIAPIAAAYFPALCRHAFDGTIAEEALNYRYLTWLAAAATLPAATSLACFAHPLMHVALHDQTLAAEVADLCPVLAAAAALGAFAIIPYQVELAHGDTRPAVMINAGLCLVGPAAYVIAINHAGGIGCALVSAALAACNVTAHAMHVHRRWLPGQVARWFTLGLLGPLLLCLCTALPLRALWISIGSDTVSGTACAAVSWLIASAGIYLCCRPSRSA